MIGQQQQTLPMQKRAKRTPDEVTTTSYTDTKQSLTECAHVRTPSNRDKPVSLVQRTDTLLSAVAV